MEKSNKLFVFKTLGNILVFRIPGNGKAIILIWGSKSTGIRFSIRIWKIKITIEVG